MINMTTYSKNLTRVQQELCYIINDEDARKVLRAMIKKMNEVGDSSERIKQWRQEAKAYILDDLKYDENYWVASYILYTNMGNFKDLFDELDNIRQELSELWDEVNELRHKKEKLEDRIEKLRDELISLPKGIENKVVKDLLYEIDNCEEDSESAQETYHKKLDRFSDLSNKLYYHLLPEIIKRAEQLIAL